MMKPKTKNQQTLVNVFTGFLGSGKTTIILNLVKSLPKDYKVVWLKNEFGNVQVDSILAQQNNIQAKEIINGCLCCVLVGKLKDALVEIKQNYDPDRIIIETSGSAYPGPIAWEIRKLGDGFKLDSIITVIDAVNFEGYKDKGFTAKLQAQETDIILINKHELTTENDLETLLDDVYDLNPNTPKIKTNKGNISKDIVFGLDSKLFESEQAVEKEHRNKHHHDLEVEIMEVITTKTFDQQKFSKFLESLPKADFYRIKGFINFGDKTFIVNYVFGKFDYVPIDVLSTTKLTFMGRNLGMYVDDVRNGLGLEEGELVVLDSIE